MENTATKNQSTLGTVGQIISRLVTSSIVLAITAFFTPGFSISNILALMLAAVVLAIMDYVIVKITGLHANPIGKGFIGFILAAATLYLTQYFVTGYSISWIAAIIGAIIYGVIDYIIPGEQAM